MDGRLSCTCSDECDKKLDVTDLGEEVMLIILARDKMLEIYVDRQELMALLEVQS
jgi:hypothetical protein